MKRVVGILIIIIGIQLVSCEKEKEIEYQYEAIVLGQGIDCGETYLIELTGLSGEVEFENGTYYADNLPSEFKINGLKIVLNCRELHADEIYACTHMGPTYPHVVVLNSELIN